MINYKVNDETGSIDEINVNANNKEYKRFSMNLTDYINIYIDENFNILPLTDENKKDIIDVLNKNLKCINNKTLNNPSDADYVNQELVYWLYDPMIVGFDSIIMRLSLDMSIDDNREVYISYLTAILYTISVDINYCYYLHFKNTVYNNDIILKVQFKIIEDSNKLIITNEIINVDVSLNYKSDIKDFNYYMINKGALNNPNVKHPLIDNYEKYGFEYVKNIPAIYEDNGVEYTFNFSQVIKTSDDSILYSPILYTPNYGGFIIGISIKDNQSIQKLNVIKINTNI